MNTAKLAPVGDPLCTLARRDWLIGQHAVITLSQPIPRLLADQVFAAGKFGGRRLFTYVKPARIDVFRTDPRQIAKLFFEISEAEYRTPVLRKKLRFAQIFAVV